MGWLVSSAVASPFRWFPAFFVATCVLLLIGLMVLRNQKRWVDPIRQLAELVAEARLGSIPIEEISRVQGGPAKLVPAIQDLLYELREQKTQISKLETEMKQRVATRTEALERQIGSLRQQATRDVLSGLCNRRMFDSYLPQIIEQCVADKLDLSLLMVDVDNFKPLNDSLGHGAGDDLLRDIGQIIRSGVRDNDMAFRVGGDEFVIVLPTCPPQRAQQVADRMAEMVDALARPLRLASPVGLSIGVASLSQLTLGDSKLLVQLADKRLYEVKSTRKTRSRNQAMPALVKKAG
jgi:diguanylate cyclase (GGDEF)-like protein